MEAIDYVTYALVIALTIGGIIGAIISIFRSRKKRDREQAVADSTGFIIPDELNKLPKDRFVWMKGPRYYTKLGKSRGAFIVVSVYGVFVLEYSVENGFIEGRRLDSRWRVRTLGGMGARSIASPLWRARVHAFTLRDDMGVAEDVPIYTMAVFPTGTRFSLHLDPWHDKIDDVDLWDDDDDWDDEDFDDEDFDDEDFADGELDEFDEDDDFDEEGDQDSEDEEEGSEDDDPFAFVGTIEDMAEFFDLRCIEEVMTFAQAQALMKRIEKRTEEIPDLDDPELEEDEKGKKLLPEEFMEFTRDYKNYDHIEAVNQRRLEEIRARKAEEAEGSDDAE